MFTVKIIQEDGSERVREARTVMFNPPGKDRNASVFIFPGKSDDPTETVENALVYVMNENGKTVADYTLYLTVAD